MGLERAELGGLVKGTPYQAFITDVKTRGIKTWLIKKKGALRCVSERGVRFVAIVEART